MSLETLFLAIAGLAVLALVAALFLMARMTPRTRASAALGAGDFSRAMEQADTGEAAGREDLFAAAVAAKHLLRLDEATAYLERILADDPSDGEAWLELGLAAAYRGNLEHARDCLARAEGLRSDLLESITLHRAWIALEAGEPAAARRLFEEIEVPLENKLRADLGAGEPIFAEWFLQAAALWRASGDLERAEWARREGLQTAPGSRLLGRLSGPPA